MTHPARYSQEVLDFFQRTIPMGTHVHDPFGGDGVRLGKLADERGWNFTGREIEESFIIDPRVRQGDSTWLSSYPRRRGFWIVTSPVYPNGMADHFNRQDGSTGRTYRQAIAQIEGADRPLAPNNMGQFGYRGTKPDGKSLKRQAYWDLADRAVACWAARGATVALVNVSDFMVGDYRERVVDGWCDVLRRNGYQIQRITKVGTVRMKFGANRDNRVDGEAIITARAA